MRYARMIWLHPDLIIRYRLRGLVKFEQTDYTGAMLDFTRFIKEDFTDHEIFVKRGYSFTELKDHVRATSDYEKALALKRDDDGYYGMISDSYLNLGDTVMAYATIPKNIAKVPTYFRPYSRRINIYIMQKRWSEAMYEVEKAISTLPKEFYKRRPCPIFCL